MLDVGVAVCCVVCCSVLFAAVYDAVVCNVLLFADVRCCLLAADCWCVVFCLLQNVRRSCRVALPCLMLFVVCCSALLSVGCWCLLFDVVRCALLCVLCYWLLFADCC